MTDYIAQAFRTEGGKPYSVGRPGGDDVIRRRITDRVGFGQRIAQHEGRADRLRYTVRADELLAGSSGDPVRVTNFIAGRELLLKPTAEAESSAESLRNRAQ